MRKQPSFSRLDHKGHFTRKKSEEIGKMQKTAEKCRPGRGRNRYKDTRKTARRGAVSMLRFDSTFALKGKKAKKEAPRRKAREAPFYERK